MYTSYMVTGISHFPLCPLVLCDISSCILCRVNLTCGRPDMTELICSKPGRSVGLFSLDILKYVLRDGYKS